VDELVLPKRWKQLRYHAIQDAAFRSDARFILSASGRRSGKTEVIAKRKAILRILEEPRTGGRFLFCAPTWDQSRMIFWQDLCHLIPRDLVRKKRESMLTLELWTGNDVRVTGLDVPARVEGGGPVYGIILDEYANMKTEVWPEHIEPMLAETLGWGFFVGVPEGRNHWYELYEFAQSEASDDWQVFHWPSSDILDPKELERIKAKLDPETYSQEYEGNFIHYAGRAYYSFDRQLHCLKGLRQQVYNPRVAIAFCFDFNVDPGCAAVLHENEGLGTCLVDEIWKEKGSNTPYILQQLLDRYRDHIGHVYCYGDASGGARHTVGESGSDWEIIRKTLKPVYGTRLHMRNARANPRERPRVNAVNARLLSIDGQVHLIVDPDYCPRVVRDFEGVVLTPDGQIEKKKSPMLTHISDAIGYYCHERFPVVSKELALQPAW
jgi:hypothetical protein